MFPIKEFRSWSHASSVTNDNTRKKSFCQSIEKQRRGGKNNTYCKKKQNRKQKKKQKKIFFVKLFALHANVVTSKRSDQIVSYIIAWPWSSEYITQFPILVFFILISLRKEFEVGLNLKNFLLKNDTLTNMVSFGVCLREHTDKYIICMQL